MRGALGVLQCTAAAHALRGRRLQRDAALLCAFAAASAGHVVLSILYVELLGGGARRSMGARTRAHSHARARARAGARAR